MPFIIFLLVMLMLSRFLEEYGEDLKDAIGALFRFVFLCFWMTLKLFAVVLWWLLTDGRRHAAAGVRAAYLFGRILWEEWHRGEEPAFTPDDDQTEPAAAGAPDAYETALGVLGLAHGFTRDDLNTAYKRTIRRAHPDAGGSVDQATTVNVARDLILAQMGWA
jgi:hypothetical protein